VNLNEIVGEIIDSDSHGQLAVGGATLRVLPPLTVKGVLPRFSAGKQASHKMSAGESSRTFAQRPINSGATVTLPEPQTRPTGELRPTPPSVTEGTTRHLGAEAPTRHLDSAGEFQK